MSSYSDTAVNSHPGDGAGQEDRDCRPNPASFHLSPYGERMAAPGGIAAIVAEVARARARGAAVVDVNAGNPPAFPQLAELWRSVAARILPREIGTSAMVYGDLGGHPALIAAVAALFAGERSVLTPEEILVTPGAQAFVQYALHAFVGPEGSGKKVLLPQCPEYEAYTTMGLPPEAFRCLPSRQEITGERSFRYVLDAGEADLSDVGLILLSRPCNPSGVVAPAGALRVLARRAAERAIPVVIDCVYAAPVPGLVYRDDFEHVFGPNVINVFSFSKAGLAGERIGVAIGPPTLLRPLRLYQARSSIMASKLGQVLAAEALASSALLPLCRDVLAPYYWRKGQQLQAICEAELGGRVPYRLHELEAGIFAWLHLPGLGMTDQALCARLAAQDIFVTPGTPFFHGSASPHAEAYLRISLTASTSAHESCIRAIAALHR